MLRTGEATQDLRARQLRASGEIPRLGSRVVARERSKLVAEEGGRGRTTQNESSSKLAMHPTLASSSSILARTYRCMFPTSGMSTTPVSTGVATGVQERMSAFEASLPKVANVFVGGEKASHRPSTANKQKARAIVNDSHGSVDSF